jgi:hypothetical protein
MFPSFRDHKTSSISSPRPPAFAHPQVLKQDNKNPKLLHWWCRRRKTQSKNNASAKQLNSVRRKPSKRILETGEEKWRRNVRGCEVEEAATEESQRDAAEGRRGACFLQTLIHCLTVGGRLNPSLGVH